MQRIDNNGSVLKLSLLALAIVAMAGCSSNDSSSQPLNPGEGTGSGGSGSDGDGTDGGGSGSDGGGTDGGSSGSGGGGQGFTYRTINPVDDIPVGEVFSLDSVTVNATPTSTGAIINEGPVLDGAATIEVLPDASDGKGRIRLNSPIAGVVNEDFIESDEVPYDFDNGDNEVKIRSQDDEGAEFIDGGSLDYAAYGDWAVPGSDGDFDFSYFAGGYQTQVGDMPTSGTAQYVGSSQGSSIVNGAGLDVIGRVSMDVDFSASRLEGQMTNMRSGDSYSTANTPWNDVSFSGGLNGNAFTGSTQATSAPNDTSLNNDAAGGVQGHFYGPQAAEAAAAWSLQDGAGNTAFGAFGAKQ
ncbi:transferrin-binding protein-like solute binding protein [Vreelandella sedimenti]|uniref:transferrin-binding protein-like solute binding protein n=1 Tax=Vreelandella sedimenti TaxID=2729618 RepID=UPI002579E4DB|nr:transferrin-binding protein-like solute binding protein [Halomonas sp. UBA3173]|tara:strand:- start:49963 stop:51024 length:1062 start_codon:yes stop_codon:yes gene_type:complete